MVVAVMPGMSNVSARLRELGYEVVQYGKYQYPIDAVVYSGGGLMSTTLTNANIAGSHGVLMVNATGRSVEEIHFALKNRVYSPLF